MARILVIEDDPTMRRLLTAHLRSNGHESLDADGGEAGLQVAAREGPDLVLLDVMMPQMDGWEVCRRLRAVSDVPIILLTAKTMQHDVIRGLSLGADDYIRKPFNLHELTLRVEAVLRRQRSDDAGPMVYDDGTLRVDHQRRLVALAGQPVHTTPTEFRLLSYLVQHAGRTVPHRELLTAVWGAEYADDTSILPVYIRYLRQKLETDRGPRYINTEWGAGYSFVGRTGSEAGTDGSPPEST